MEKNDTISILYVEDQDDVRLFLSKILSRHYSKVFLAENGKQGLELYNEHKPDIIISDIKMPVMDGLSMSNRIKEIDPNAKIILTTAHSDMEYFIQSIEIGINQYILKPIDREKLYKAINTCKEQVLMEREVIHQNKKLIQSHETLTKHERELRENLQKTIALKEIIAKSEQNFRKVAENIQDAFWLRDQNKILFVNKAFEILFEIPSSHLFDNPDIFKEFIHEDDKEKFFQLLYTHEQNQSGTLGTEFRIVSTSGKIKNIWYRDIFIKSEKHSELRRLSTLSDISWKIENEKLQQNLLVAEKSAEIKDRLLANVSHEIRTPLNGIFAMSEILASTSLTSEQIEYLDTIRKSGEDLLELTNELLDIHELEMDKYKIEKQNINTTELFQPLINNFTENAADKGLSFYSEFSKDFPDTFITDPKRISQVFEHFCLNAIKFTTQGEIKVLFNVEQSVDNIKILSFTVTDTGIGIKESYLDKVFHSFSQQEDNDNRTFDGLGLGLTICQKISDLLKGSIDIKSEVGKGSEFKFSFPVTHEADNSPIPEITSTAKIPNLNLHVLCVEDKEVNQKILSIMLKNAGCTVDIAPNGLEALNLVDKNRYDIILMDIQMPVMDGITSTQNMRKKYKTLPPIIGVSANALRADAQHYISQGLDDYISKPVIPAILYQKIQQWLGDKEQKPETDSDDEKKSESLISIEYSQLDDLDQETLNTLREQTHNDIYIIHDLYNTFILEADILINKITGAADENDNGELKDATHALKGLSATIGALKVYHITSEMDKLHKQGIYEESKSLSEILAMEYNKIKKIIYEQVVKA